MTIYDISEKAGVSIATVSRVLNGSANVSDKTRERVLSVISECGYTPNVFARGLGLNTMKTIGIMCADSSDSYLARAVYNIEQELRANGYDSLLSCTGYNLKDKEASINLLLSKKVDGIILVGSHFAYEKEEDNNYIALAAAQVPVMILNAQLAIPNVYSVVSDDFQSIYEATSELLSDGIEDLIYFYNSTSYSAKRKYAGYKAALADKKLAAAPERLQFYQGKRDDLHGMVDHLLHLSENGHVFHGVIASDDILGLAALKFAKRMGYSVPEDFVIVGYNNSMLSECCDPELTSIDNKPEILCHHLVTTLMGVLNGEEMPKKSIFSGELVKKGTTK